MASIRNVVVGRIDALGNGVNSFLGFLMAIPVALHVLLCLGEEAAPFDEHGNIITVNVIYGVKDPLAI
jgi:hypothetical protein